MISDLLAIRKSNNVKRYHTETLIKEETVGHHVANVCMILCWLYKEHGIPARVLRAAVLHDAAEVYTGDAPAPIKWEYPQIEQGYKEAEADFWGRLKDQRGLWEPPYRDLTDGELSVVKWADMMELCLKCINESELGNDTLRGMFLKGVIVTEQRYGKIPANLKSRASILMNYIRSIHDESKRYAGSGEPLPN